MSVMNCTRSVATLTALVLASAAMANPITPVSQVRTIFGQSTSTGSAGDFDTGHMQIDATEGDFGTWESSLIIPGPINGPSTQSGGFNGVDTIALNAFTMNMGGGFGPGAMLAGSIHNEFTYTFTVGQGAAYTFNLNAGCADPSSPPGVTNDWSIVAYLAGPGGDVFRYETGVVMGYSLSAQDVTGTLNAGQYTLSFVGTGAVTVDTGENGNGWGGGAGGTSPIMTFHVEGGETPVCPGDLGTAGGQPGQDGQLNNNDFIAFITYFFNQDTHADLGTTGGLPGHDGAYDNNDFIAFINLFFAGC
ncbi:MAG: GC-type dockerin domain-anchored protein [Phycisphaerales bacterium]